MLRLEDYGALVSLYNSTGKASGVQGLLHKSEMSWDLVWTVDEVVTTGGGVGGGGEGGVKGGQRGWAGKDKVVTRCVSEGFFWGCGGGI